VPTAEFVQSNTRLRPVSHVPELLLHQADEPIEIWELTEGAQHAQQPPPFWAFPWAGGLALARYLLDHPAVVAGRSVLDLASGSGLVALAAARAGAASVRAVDIDPTAAAAIRLNADANGLAVTVAVADILDGDAGDADVVLAGDVFYSQAMAERMLGYLRRAALAGAEVLVGDPERAFLPREQFTPLAVADVTVPPVLESTTVRRTTVWRLRSGQLG
jgi:predicted nicotinamide N-methyase